MKATNKIIFAVYLYTSIDFGNVYRIGVMKVGI